MGKSRHTELMSKLDRVSERRAEVQRTRKPSKGQIKRDLMAEANIIGRSFHNFEEIFD